MPKDLCAYMMDLLVFFFLFLPMVVVLVVIMSPALLFIWLCEKFPEKPFQDTLLGQWAKAKKEKVCPLIEYVAEDCKE
jgi:hypothetical protein